MVKTLVERIKASVETITSDFEIILVNDASPDMSWREIETQCKEDMRVKGVNLSRNFGQHYAITAGLSFASGDWIVVMDCDLQDRPEEIPVLYAKAQEGWDIVMARRIDRQDRFFKRLSSTLFNAVFNWLSGTNKDSSEANFGIYKKAVIDEYNKMPEYARAFTSLVAYLGFKKSAIDVEHAERLEGSSSYSLRTLLKLAFDVMISNTNKPLMMSVQIGFLMAIISFTLAIYNFTAKLIGLVEVAGYTSTIFSIWFVGGLIMMMMGVIGLYIDKIFDQVKGRQIFIVMDKLNL